MSRGSRNHRVQLRSRWADVGGVRIHAYAGGGGSPVVLVHGFGVSSRYMLPLARELAPAHSVHALDLPGHGQSEMPRIRLSISSLSESVEDWLDAVGLERPAFVANSMGC